jgi:hypothetical protein
MERLEMDIVQRICKYTMIFPPLFLDSIKHLSIYLPFEVKVGGLV